MPDMRYALTIHANEVMSSTLAIATVKGHPADLRQEPVTLLRLVVDLDHEPEMTPELWLRDVLVAVAERL